MGGGGQWKEDNDQVRSHCWGYIAAPKCMGDVTIVMPYFRSTHHAFPYRYVRYDRGFTSNIDMQKVSVENTWVTIFYF